MGTLAATTHTKNGGFTSLGRKTVSYDIRGAEPCISTRAITVKAGQVLKAKTWLESDSAGKMIAHAALPEIAKCVFTASTNGETVIMAGLTWTSGASGTTVAQLVAAWSDIAAGTGYAALADRTAGGSFTAGTLTGYNTVGVNATTIEFQGITVGAATDVAATGTGGTDVAAITITQYAAANKVAGLLAMDVDATSADVEAQMYISGNFWSDYIVWDVDPTVDTITISDGTTVACTAYRTGCGDSELFRQKFLENAAGGTEFAIGQFNASEVEV